MNKEIPPLITIDDILRMPLWTGSDVERGTRFALGKMNSMTLYKIEPFTQKHSLSAERQMYMESLRISQSPWLVVIDKLDTRYYKSQQRDVSNNRSAGLVLKWVGEIEKNVDSMILSGEIEGKDRESVVTEYEVQLSNKVSSELSSASEEEIREWKSHRSSQLLRRILSSDEKYKPHKRGEKPLSLFIGRQKDSVLEKARLSETDAIGTGTDPSTNIQPNIRQREPISTYPNISPLYRTALVLQLIAGFVGSISQTPKNTNTEVSESERIFQPTRTQGAEKHVQLTLTPPGTGVSSQLPEGFLQRNGSRIGKKTKASEPSETPVSPDEQVKPIMTISEPEPVYQIAGIDFSKQEPVRMTIKLPSLGGIFDFGKRIKTTFTPIVHKDVNNETEDLKYFEQVSPGKNKAGVHIDSATGDLRISLHDGRIKKEGSSDMIPLELEHLRVWLQGSNPDNPEKYVSRAETQRRLTLLTGTEWTFTTKDGTARTYRVIATGIIPHEMAGKYWGDAKNTIGTIISATGGENSSFNTHLDIKGITVDFCLQNIEARKTDPNWARWEPAVIRLIPTDESVAQHEKEVAKTKESELSMPQLEKSARMLTRILETASARVKDSGDTLKNFVTDQLKLYGVPIGSEFGVVIDDIANETAQVKIQCTQGLDLLGTLPGSEGIVADQYGWEGVDNAREYIMDDKGRIDPKLQIKGGYINKGGVNIYRMESLSRAQIGDKIVLHKTNHVVLVINTWVDEGGKTHLKIFDVNYERQFGLPRILEDVTMDNIYSQIAEGIGQDMFLIRPQEKTVLSSNN